MKAAILQVVVILGLAALVGVATNGVRTWNDSDNRLNFVEPSTRYPDAQVCKPVREDEGYPAAGGSGLASVPPGKGLADPEFREPGATNSAGASSTDPPADGESGTQEKTGAPGDPTAAADASSDVGGSPRSTEPTEPKIVDGFEHIGHAAAKRAWEDGVLFVDARDPKYYREGHVPGAVNVYAYDASIAEKIQEIADTWGPAAPVVVYCNESTECHDSHIVASQMRLFDFSNLRVYEGGFPGWFKAKELYVVGDEPGTREDAVRPATKEGE